MIKRKNRLKLYSGVCFFCIGFVILSINLLCNFYTHRQEELAIKSFYHNPPKIKKEDLKLESNNKTKTNDIEYIAVLNIPKIELKRGLVNFTSKLNDIKFNIEILDNSLQTDDYHQVILAAHSGDSDISYFNNLENLIAGDSIILDYNGYSNIYRVSSIYETKKTGKIAVPSYEEDTIILITCKNNTDMHLVVVAKLFTKILLEN